MQSLLTPKRFDDVAKGKQGALWAVSASIAVKNRTEIIA